MLTNTISQNDAKSNFGNALVQWMISPREDEPSSQRHYSKRVTGNKNGAKIVKTGNKPCSVW